jgi:drug/metabolite transporter (DMT)-like permease
MHKNNVFMPYGFFFNILDNTKKGIIFGIFGTFLVGFQPIIAISRPSVLDAHFFAAMTCLIEAFIFLPLVLGEIYFPKGKKDNNFRRKEKVKIVLNNWKSNFKTLIFIGFIFGLNQLLYFIGYDFSGAINGSLTQKTTVFFGLIFGYAILKEKVNSRQILFSIILFIGLIIAITQGKFFSFDLDTLVGVLILLFITCLWMYGHTITKPIFNRREATPTQMVFLRNLLSGIILIATYFLFFPFSNLSLFSAPLNQIYFVSMGVVYGFGLFCWYKTLSYLDVSKATIIFSPTPIVTAIFAYFLLGRIFTIFHLIGTIIVITSIIIILFNKDKVKST